MFLLQIIIFKRFLYLYLSFRYCRCICKKCVSVCSNIGKYVKLYVWKRFFLHSTQKLLLLTSFLYKYTYSVLCDLFLGNQGLFNEYLSETKTQKTSDFICEINHWIKYLFLLYFFNNVLYMKRAFKWFSRCHIVAICRGNIPFHKFIRNTSCSLLL